MKEFLIGCAIGVALLLVFPGLARSHQPTTIYDRLHGHDVSHETIYDRLEAM